MFTFFYFFLFFFFFQAEDGIRDKLVTGVQTCALPILAGEEQVIVGRAGALDDTLGGIVIERVANGERARAWIALQVKRRRSEERRVGKECRSRWSPDH